MLLPRSHFWRRSCSEAEPAITTKPRQAPLLSRALFRSLLMRRSAMAVPVVAMAATEALAVAMAAMAAMAAVAAMGVLAVAEAVELAPKAPKGVATARVPAKVVRSKYMTKALTIGIGITALTVAILVGWWYMYVTKYQARYTDTKTVYSVLIIENQAFAEGNSLLRAGKPDLAIPKFEEALRYSQDPTQEGQIKIKLALAIEMTGDYGNPQKSVPLLKEIAANPAYTNITRAYAVQEMAQIFYTYVDKRISAEIFKDEPYKSLWVQGAINLSYRHLYERASSFYPLALSELRIADWYATQVVDLHEKAIGGVEDTTVNARIAQYKDVVRQKIASAERDLERIKGNSNESPQAKVALFREGIIIAKMQLTGDESFGDMEMTFKRALDVYAALGTPQEDGYVRYYYAQYLARLYGPSREDDVRGILSKFYTTDLYQGALATIFFKNERNNIVGAKKQLVLLASLDPKFKDYLLSLGWKAADFVKS